MPSRIHSTHTCTCAQFLHNGDAVSCAVALREWEQMSRPAEEHARLVKLILQRVYPLPD